MPSLLAHLRVTHLLEEFPMMPLIFTFTLWLRESRPDALPLLLGLTVKKG